MNVIRAQCGHWVRVSRGPFSRNRLRVISRCPTCIALDELTAELPPVLSVNMNTPPDPSGLIRRARAAMKGCAV